MTENPYLPPSGKASSAAKPPWYETKPADWESTVAMSWITGVAVLLWTGFVPLPAQETLSGLKLIPGPEVIGGIAYIGVALMLAILPAVFWGLLHLAAMQMSSQKPYRRGLTMLAKFFGIVLTLAAGVLCQFLMIR